MEYTQEDQDRAIKTLTDLVNENHKLRGELYKAQEFCLRFLLADNFTRSEKEFSFTDNAIIDYQEDWERILPYFFFNFYPNSNCNPNIEDGTFVSKFSIEIKNGTPFPTIGTREEIRDKINELIKRFDLLG